MIDLGRLRINSRLNYQNGLTFYFSRQGQVISFLVDTIRGRKRYTRVTMHPDPNHGRPHVHINEHDASFAIDTGELLAGNCDARVKSEVQEWILRHRIFASTVEDSEGMESSRNVGGENQAGSSLC